MREGGKKGTPTWNFQAANHGRVTKLFSLNVILRWRILSGFNWIRKESINLQMRGESVPQTI